jgi:hypothetical protein
MRTRHPIGRRADLATRYFAPAASEVSSVDREVCRAALGGAMRPVGRRHDQLPERASSATHGEIATPLAMVEISTNMRSQAIQKRAPLRAQAAAPERSLAIPGAGFPQATMICASGRSSGCLRHGGNGPVSGQSCARISRKSPISFAISASTCTRRKPKRRGFSGSRSC